ncbi:MAG: hypothetical protein OEV08_15470 [Nitrospira sp.]|nr:hypothetical protein [Nitrospira sp.]
MSGRLRRDLKRYFELNSKNGNPGLFEKLGVILEAPGLHATIVFRFGSWVNRTFKFKLFRYPLMIIYQVLNKLCIILWGIHIDKRADIGGGLYIGHFGGVLIGPVKMGGDCNISHGVTIGRRAGRNPAVPTIGDRVWVGPGSVIFGGIHIGDGVTIGPLTVVGRNLPPQALVVGNPMKLLRRSYNNEDEIYGDRQSCDSGASR